MKKLLNAIIMVILILNTAYISYAQYKSSLGSSTYVSKAESLKNELTILSMEIDEKIEDLEKLIEDLESKQEVLDELKGVQSSIKVDISTDLDKIKEIEEITPLDIKTSTIVFSYAKKFNIKPSLILALIKLESNFDQFAVGEDDDRGYMQIIPPTEKWLAEKYGDKIGIKYNPEKIFEPEYNIGLGVLYLSILKEAYGENYERILSEYNRGPYNLKAYFEKHNTYSTSYSRGVLKREKKFKKLND